MATAAELGISEQEFQDALYLEKMYQVVSACRDSCTRCGSSVRDDTPYIHAQTYIHGRMHQINQSLQPIIFYKTDTIDLLCRKCGNNKPHSRRLGDAHFRRNEVEKFERKYGTSR